jgi:stage V sporulation protein B
VPVAASAYVRSGLVTLEHILIPFCLALGTASRSEALASYGVLHSMAIPMLLYPTAVSSAFSGLLVTEMAESRARGDVRRIRYMTERALSFTLIFGIGCAGLLLSFAPALGEALYRSEEAGRYIALLAPVAAVMYLDTTVDNILKGLGYQVYSMGVNIADSALSILMVLLFLPRMGADGYVLVVILAEVFNFSCSVLRLLRATAFRLPLFAFWHYISQFCNFFTFVIVFRMHWC